MNGAGLLIFDMDGVLVDVTESYRETIARTVEHFTGRTLTREQIQEYKNHGGWNDDWQLSHHIVNAAGVDVPFEEVKAHFQRIFHGNGADGLILRERWIARPGFLETLQQRYRFALFTGRPREEAQITLDRFAAGLVFDPIVGMYEVERHKPAPDGLLRILRGRAQRAPREGVAQGGGRATKEHEDATEHQDATEHEDATWGGRPRPGPEGAPDPQVGPPAEGRTGGGGLPFRTEGRTGAGCRLGPADRGSAPYGVFNGADGPVFYIGDTVDDARAAHAARVPFIGIAGPDNPLYVDLVFLFQAAGAYAIIDDINYLEEVLLS